MICVRSLLAPLELERAHKKKSLREAERAAASAEKAAEKGIIDKPALNRQVRRDAKAQELQEASAGVAAMESAADDSDSMLIEEEVDEKADAVAVETLGDAAEEEAAKKRRKAAQKKATLARAQELLARLAKEDRPRRRTTSRRLVEAMAARSR
jgi:hypothetical protein